MKERTQTPGIRTDRNAGFTLLEVVVSVTIFALLIGVLVPLTDSYIGPKLVNDTRAEMEILSDAILRFYEDVGDLPGDLTELLEMPEEAPGWAGPYFSSNFEDAGSVGGGPTTDEWLQDYVYIKVTDGFELRSWGPNRTDENGDGDDLILDGFLGVANREITHKEIRELAIAIQNYNRVNLPSGPLSTNHDVLVSQLQGAGFLPNDTATTLRLTNDAWGNKYVPGISPTMVVTSLGGL